MAQDGKGVCLVVGAGDGVGGAIARAFAAEGHPVCITRRARNLDQLEALAADIRETGAAAPRPSASETAEGGAAAAPRALRRTARPRAGCEARWGGTGPAGPCGGRGGRRGKAPAELPPGREGLGRGAERGASRSVR